MIRWGGERKNLKEKDRNMGEHRGRGGGDGKAV